MSDKPIPMPWGEGEQMPPAFESRQNNPDEIDEEDCDLDPARYQFGGHPHSDFPYRR